MGTFRALSADDVRDILSGYGLSGYRSHAAIAAGTINTNVRVELADRAVFLRVNEGKALREVEREAAIVSHLAARGVPTPVPLPTRDGKLFARFADAYVSLFPWLAGRILSRVEMGAPHAAQVGGSLARLHAAGLAFPDHRPGRYEPDEIARRFDVIAGISDPELAEAIAIIGPELAALARERTAGVPEGLIHGDLFIDNVLYDDDGRLVALLDFEQASWGRLPYDIAVTLLAFGFGADDFRTDVTRAFLDGYLGVRTPTAIETEAFACELRFAACRFTVTRITDVYLRRRQGAPGGKDFRRYLRRLERIKHHLAIGDGLFALAA